jgi:phage host-nuclease inhibitor protein Gam
MNINIKTWAGADEAIQYIGLLQIKRDRLEGKMNEKLIAIKDEAYPKISELDQEILNVREGLEAWCSSHRAEMQQPKQGGGLTWKGAFGRAAFRKCPPSITFIVKNVQKVLAALKARKLTNCVRMVEEPNKEAMALLDEETLRAVGAKRGAEEKFEIKPDYQAIAAQEATE